jgi:hypothetical protein
MRLAALGDRLLPNLTCASQVDEAEMFVEKAAS